MVSVIYFSSYQADQSNIRQITNIAKMLFCHTEKKILKTDGDSNYLMRVGHKLNTYLKENGRFLL